MSGSESIVIRAFASADKRACLDIFDGNTPEFFAAEERAEYARFLDASETPYFVAVGPSAEIIGCGGFYLEGGHAGLTWGMVARSWHRRGIGRALLEWRIRRIQDLGAVSVVRVNTSQRSRAFFERQGFVARSVAANGFAPGLDRIEMTRALRAASSPG